MIFIPKHQEIIVPTQAERGVAGRYKLRKGKNAGYMDANSGLWIPGRDVVTGEVGWCNNIITNGGLDQLGGAVVFSSVGGYFHVGSGTGAPAATDTSLSSWIAATSALQNSELTAQASAPYFGSWAATRRFSEGAAEGVIAEVGVGSTASNLNLYSRARVLDGGGSPTTITVLADEWLDVVYEHRVYPDHINSDGSTNDGTGTISFSGTPYNYTIRPANVNDSSFYDASDARGNGVAWSGATDLIAYGTGTTLGAVTSVPSGGTASPITGASIAGATYSDGTYNRDCTWTVGLTEGNISGGIKALVFKTGMGAYQVLFNNPLPKDDTKVWTYVHNIAWTRATIA